MKPSAGISKDYSLPSIGYHNCSKSRPELKDLIRYSSNIAAYWKDIALQLGIPEHHIMMIDIAHPHVRKKCLEMFETWLAISVNACWCHFKQALYDVGLDVVAEEAKRHLQLTESSRVHMYGGKTKVICIDNCVNLNIVKE